MMTKTYRLSKPRLGIMIVCELLVIGATLGTAIGPVLGLLMALFIVLQVLSYFFVHISVEEEGIELVKGLISRDTTQVPFKKINTITIRQGLFGRIFNYGNITIYTGNDKSGIKLLGIESPNELKKIV